MSLKISTGLSVSWSIHKMNRTNGRVNGFFLSLIILHIAASVAVSMLAAGGVVMGTVASLMFTQMLILVPSFLFFLIFRYDLFEWIPFKKLKAGTILLIVLFTFLIMPFISFINIFSQLFTTNTAVEMSNEFMGVSPVVITLIVGFIGPFCEEFTFRGVIFGGLRKSGYVFAAAVVSGVYFGLMHLNLNQFSYALILGVIFCMLVEATGSIFASIISHAVINTWNIVLMIVMDKAYSDMGIDIFDMAQDVVTTDDKLAVMGVLIVISVITTALAAGVYIAISRNEGRFDEVTGMFFRPAVPAGSVTSEADQGQDAVTDGQTEYYVADENAAKEDVAEERVQDKVRCDTPKNRLITLTGYMGIFICLFVIFLLDRVMAWFSK